MSVSPSLTVNLTHPPHQNQSLEFTRHCLQRRTPNGSYKGKKISLHSWPIFANGAFDPQKLHTRSAIPLNQLEHLVTPGRRDLGSWGFLPPTISSQPHIMPRP